MTGDGMIVMLLVTKNESDLLRSNLDHHLSWGIDHIAVADNRSTDATADVANGFGDHVTHRVFSDFHTRQTVRHTMLHELMDRYAGRVEWAGISDTDEFFWADRSMRELLDDAPADVVAVNFDAKLFLPTALDPPDGTTVERRQHRTSSGESPLHTSYVAGKTFYRASWLTSIPVDHWCKRHEHLCIDVPHDEWRHEVPAAHHYMIQDEDQFVEKVVRLIEWAKPPTSLRGSIKWRLTPKRDRPLPHWSEPWKKDWWRVYQDGGVEAVRRYYREVYVIPAEEVGARLAAGDLVRDDSLARHTRDRLAHRA